MIGEAADTDGGVDDEPPERIDRAPRLALQQRVDRRPRLRQVGEDMADAAPCRLGCNGAIDLRRRLQHHLVDPVVQPPHRAVEPLIGIARRPGAGGRAAGQEQPGDQGKDTHDGPPLAENTKNSAVPQGVEPHKPGE